MSSRCFEPIVFEKKTCVQPLFAIQIEGFDTPITSGDLKAQAALDEGFCLDEGLCLDGFAVIKDELTENCLDDGSSLDEGLCLDTLNCVPGFLDCLSSDGFSSNITQKLDPSRNSTSSISSFNMRVLDTNCWMSRLYSRGNLVKDILNSRVDVYVTFCGPDLNFPDEYKKIFRGFITKVCSGPGYVDFTIDHPDKKKQQDLFESVDTRTFAISDTATTFNVATPAGSELKAPVDCLRTALVVNEDVIEYTNPPVDNGDGTTTISGGIRNQGEFTSFCIPETLTHANGSEASSLCILEGNPIDLALKIMRSGSQEPGPYNTLGQGLGMDLEDVDIERHEELRDTYLSDAFVRIYLDEGVDAKSLIEDQLYKPFGLYSVPRDTKSSVNYFQPPIYPDTVPVFDRDCIVNCSSIRICRSLDRNFFNQVLYKFDKSPCEDEYSGGVLSINSESIDCYDKRQTFEVCSDGLRSEFGALRLARDSSLRRLDRFAFAAEYIEGMEVFFQAAINVEIGDTVGVDFTDLQVTNSDTGKRDAGQRLFEVVNKKFNVKTGRAFLDLLETGISAEFTDIRPASVAPCSKSTNYLRDQVILTQNDCFEGVESEKWCVGDKVVVRNSDYSICEETEITAINGMEIILSNEIPFGADCLFVELADYDTAGQTECTDLRFAYISDSNNNFSDGTIPYTAA